MAKSPLAIEYERLAQYLEWVNDKIADGIRYPDAPPEGAMRAAYEMRERTERQMKELLGHMTGD